MHRFTPRSSTRGRFRRSADGPARDTRRHALVTAMLAGMRSGRPPGRDGAPAAEAPLLGATQATLVERTEQPGT